ncbi:MAG: class I SAM-dependent methyltransferase [Vicingaceae bacterium]
MKDFWNERYRNKEYVYGKSPNEFLKKQLSHLPVGKILLPSEGEGRNAVYAAENGWEVTAFDQSESAKSKAEQLATDKNVDINFQLADASTFDYGKEEYDLIALIYAHFPPKLRKKVHTACVQALKKGGHLILEGFRTEQLNFQSGGPKKEEMLFTDKMIKEDFKSLAVKQLYLPIIHLNEGKYHQGEAAVIQYIGQK